MKIIERWPNFANKVEFEPLMDGWMLYFWGAVVAEQGDGHIRVNRYNHESPYCEWNSHDDFDLSLAMARGSVARIITKRQYDLTKDKP